MRYQTQVTVKFKNKGNLQNSVTSFVLNENITVSEFKTEIKKTLRFLDTHSIENEIVYLGSNKLNDSDIVPSEKSGLQFFIEVTNK